MGNILNMGYKLNHMVDLSLLDDGVVIDGGSAKGEFLTAFRKLNNQCTVYCFECNATNLKSLIDLKDQNMYFFREALVGEGSPKIVKFTEFKGVDGKYYQWGNIYGNHKDNSDNMKLEEIVEYMVPTTTLREVIEKTNINIISYLKLDIEGAEEEIFNTLSPDVIDKIKQFSVEYHSESARKAIYDSMSALFDLIEDKVNHEIYGRKKV